MIDTQRLTGLRQQARLAFGNGQRSGNLAAALSAWNKTQMGPSLVSETSEAAEPHTAKLPLQSYASRNVDCTLPDNTKGDLHSVENTSFVIQRAGADAAIATQTTHVDSTPDLQPREQMVTSQQQSRGLDLMSQQQNRLLDMSLQHQAREQMPTSQPQNREPQLTSERQTREVDLLLQQQSREQVFPSQARVSELQLTSQQQTRELDFSYKEQSREQMPALQSQVREPELTSQANPEAVDLMPQPPAKEMEVTPQTKTREVAFDDPSPILPVGQSIKPVEASLAASLSGSLSHALKLTASMTTSGGGEENCLTVKQTMQEVTELAKDNRQLVEEVLTLQSMIDEVRLENERIRRELPPVSKTTAGSGIRR